MEGAKVTLTWTLQYRAVIAMCDAMSGPEAFVKQRAQGIDPAHGGKAKDKRAASQSKRARERAEWEAFYGDGQAEREHFIREVQPKLADIPLRQISEATGFSLRYASLVRNGEYVPHPVHYSRLERLMVMPESGLDEIPPPRDDPQAE